MEPETAGDPAGKTLRWTRKSTYKISKALKKENGIKISPNSSGRILKHLGYSLKLNRKSKSETHHKDRDLQFQQIGNRVKAYEDIGQPIISVDTKKKELIGNFSNTGKKYEQHIEKTLTHDFKSSSIGKANPYGIWERFTNRGTVIIGTSKDTPEFAADSIEIWLVQIALTEYSNLKKMLILCDSGGSNGYRVSGWKYYLYHKICKVYGIEIDICHYPSGASKWNPIEHKLFCHISQNWAGVPLRSYDTVINYINTTTTDTGLNVKAIQHDKIYEAGQKFSKEQMNSINIKRSEILPQWNYKIYF
jgi:hypothetical protein